MAQTTHYGLYTNDDSSKDFLSWRTELNGTTESNMTIIDNVLYGKADNSVLIEATLSGSGWVGVTAPFTQDIAVDGMTATMNGTISISHDATAEQREIAREAMLGVIGQSDGTLTVVADGEMPERDIPVYILLLY